MLKSHLKSTVLEVTYSDANIQAAIFSKDLLSHDSEPRRNAEWLACSVQLLINFLSKKMYSFVGGPRSELKI